MQTRKKILVVDDDTNSIAIAEELLVLQRNIVNSPPEGLLKTLPPIAAFLFLSF